MFRNVIKKFKFSYKINNIEKKMYAKKYFEK